MLVPDVLGTAGVQMQVTTATSCAAGALNVVGPHTFGCPFVTNTLFGCGFIPAPVVVTPFVSTPVVTIPTVVPVRTCVPVLVGNAVVCR